MYSQVSMYPITYPWNIAQIEDIQEECFVIYKSCIFLDAKSTVKNYIYFGSVHLCFIELYFW